MEDEAVIATRRAYERDASAWAAGRSDRDYWSTRVAAFVRRIVHAGRVLDLGCGPGVATAVLASKGLRVVGYDLTRAMLEVAMEQEGGFGLTQGDSRSLPFKAASFDAVWASASLLHLPKRQAPGALAEVARVLGPNGIFYSSMKEGDQDRLEMPGQRSDIRGQRYFAHYQVAEWSSLVRAAGFSILEQNVEPDPRAGYPDWIVTIAEGP